MHMIHLLESLYCQFKNIIAQVQLAEKYYRPKIILQCTKLRVKHNLPFSGRPKLGLATFRTIWGGCFTEITKYWQYSPQLDCLHNHHQNRSCLAHCSRAGIISYKIRGKNLVLP